jgi:hypothetical protein
MDYRPVTQHSLPLEIAPNLFVVYGSVKINPLVRFTRNMAIVRDNGELTLINAVRLDDDGLQVLESLGEVKHVLRLGCLHGMDDTFYADRYNAEFWGFPGGTTYTEPAVDHGLEEGAPLPFPNARLFEFDHISQREGVILLEQEPGILLTVDSIQSYATPPHKPHTNLFTRLILPLRGFPNRTIVGPLWTRMLADDKDALHREFVRLLDMKFEQLLSAHGTFLPAGAHRAVEAAVAARFGTA